MSHERFPNFSHPLPTLPPHTAIISPVSLKAPAITVATRALQRTGEALTAALIIVGGIAAYGFLPVA
ncbi:hypothetical protein [Methylobacterium sp. A54F]